MFCPLHVISGRVTSWDRASAGSANQWQEVTRTRAAGVPPVTRTVTYQHGTDHLLRAVEGPCERRGIRCTDATGDGPRELLIFKCE